MKPAKNQKTKSTPPVQTIPADLASLVDSVKVIVDIHNLLSNGSFPSTAFDRVKSGITYLEAVYKETFDKAISHPQANLVPELVNVQAKETK